MLRRTVRLPLKLVVVESPTKVTKIGGILRGVPDWTFGNSQLKAGSGAAAREDAQVIATVGHFMELRNIKFHPKPLPTQPLPRTVAAPLAPPATPASEAPRDGASSAASAAGDEAGLKQSSKKERSPKKKKSKKGDSPENVTSDPQSSSATLEPLVDLSAFSPSTAPLREFELDWAEMERQSGQNLVFAVQSAEPHVSEVVLATDPDREGELIAFHAWTYLKRAFPKASFKYSRAYIHSITEDGVLKAMRERRMNGVDIGLETAAQARHAMDRLFGYLGSSFVRHANPNFRSIGRVQTPALIAVRDREERIDAYMAAHKATFSVQANVEFDNAAGLRFTRHVTLHEVTPGDEAKAVAAIPPLAPERMQDKASVEAHEKKVTESYVAALKLDTLSGISCAAPKVSEASTMPPAPFTMATLISKANRSLKLSSDEIARSLQELFQAGLITYPRTDSTRIEAAPWEAIREHAAKLYGKGSVAPSPSSSSGSGGAAGASDDDSEGNKLAKKKASGKKSTKGGGGSSAASSAQGNAEDAHEAIRPTNLAVDAAALRSSSLLASGSRQSVALYDLIYRTTLASAMTPLVHDKVSQTVTFRSGSGAVLSFKLEARAVQNPGFSVAFKDTAGPSDDEGSPRSSGTAEQSSDHNDIGEGASSTGAHDDNATFDAVKNLGKRLSAKDRCFSLTNFCVVKSKPSPPPQLTEGSLIELLKEHHVGRPSTYPTIVKTLLTRGYVSVNDKGKLETTAVGQDLAKSSLQTFPSLVDLAFTARFEKKLDVIARSATEGPHNADLVLSAFLNELLGMIMEATVAQRKSILYRSTRAQLRHTKPNATDEEVDEAVNRLFATLRASMANLPARLADVRDFNEAQNRFERFLRSEFPPLAQR